MCAASSSYSHRSSDSDDDDFALERDSPMSAVVRSERLLLAKLVARLRENGAPERITSTQTLRRSASMSAPGMHAAHVLDLEIARYAFDLVPETDVEELCELKRRFVEVLASDGNLEMVDRHTNLSVHTRHAKSIRQAFMLRRPLTNVDVVRRARAQIDFAIEKRRELGHQLYYGLREFYRNVKVSPKAQSSFIDFEEDSPSAASEAKPASKPLWLDVHDRRASDHPARLPVTPITAPRRRRARRRRSSSAPSSPRRFEEATRTTTRSLSDIRSDRLSISPKPSASSINLYEQEEPLLTAKRYVKLKRGEQLVLGDDERPYVVTASGAVYAPAMIGVRKDRRYLTPLQVERILSDPMQQLIEARSPVRMEAILRRDKSFSSKK